MTVLCYHAVDPAWRSPLSTSPERFRRHCGWLARHRRVVRLDEAVERIDGRGRLPNNLCAITFDDGLASLHEHALVSLSKQKLPATVFVVAATLEPQPQPVDWIHGVHGGRLQPLDVRQIREMQAAGIDFGSHTYAHRDMTTLTEKECLRDFRASKELLEEVLGQEVRYLAYPRGLHDEHVRTAARLAGFTHAFGTARPWAGTSRWGIPRMGVYSGDGSVKLRIKSSRRYPALRMSRLYGTTRALLDSSSAS